MPYGQFFAVVEETTWGTAPARTKFAKVMAGSGLHHRADRAKSSKLSANVGADPEGNFDKGQWGEGKIILPMSYDDGAGFKVLKHLIGSVPTTTGAGPYVHTFKRLVGPPFTGGVSPTATSLACELNYELPDAGPLQSRLLSGARVKSGRFSWSAGEEIVLDCDLFGKEVTQVIKTANPVYPDYETHEMKFSQAALKIGNVSYGAVCSGLDFTINNGYDTRIRLGSINTQAPLRKGVAELSGNLRIDWEASPSAKALWDGFKANTPGAIEVTLTSGAYSFVVTLGKCFFNASEMTPDEGQLQGVEFPFLAYDAGADTAVKIVATSPNSVV
jgi:hypothetical protein